jgi:hypothetical protein
LNKRFEAARQLYNACLDEAKRRLDLLRQSKDFQEARKMPKTVAGKSNQERTEAFKTLNAHLGFSEYDRHIYATQIRNSWIGNHLDSATAQKIATRAFKAVQRIAFGQAKRVRFKGKGQFKSVEGKSNHSGIRYKEETGQIEWNGLKLLCIIDVNDEVVVHGLSCRVKYGRIVKRIFNIFVASTGTFGKDSSKQQDNGKTRFFVQLILEGQPLKKFEAPDNTVGLDIGPSTIAHVTEDNAVIERFCDELKDKQVERALHYAFKRKSDDDKAKSTDSAERTTRKTTTPTEQSFCPFRQ